MIKFSKLFKLTCVSLMLFGVSIEGKAEDSQQATSLNISSDVKPGAVVAVHWKGPNKPGDQVILHEAGSDDWMSSQYTAQGNPVGIGMPDEPGLYELRYNSMTAGVLATLAVDCRKEVISVEHACKIENTKK